MRRLHLFEFGDQAWLPRICRRHLTDLLEYQIRRNRLYEPAVGKLIELLQATRYNRIVDLCSGSGGPLLQIQKALQEQQVQVSVLLTDKFPDRKTSARLRHNGATSISYCETPVDATAVPHGLVGVRTLFTGFHHFDTANAVKVLRDTVEDNAPIAIFEFTERRLVNVLGMSLAPVAVLSGTRRLTPFEWSRLLLTYVLPVIPFLYWWDGTVSHLRTYTVPELWTLVARADAGAYHWEIGQARRSPSAAPVTYLIGYPFSGVRFG